MLGGGDHPAVAWNDNRLRLYFIDDYLVQLNCDCNYVLHSLNMPRRDPIISDIIYGSHGAYVLPNIGSVRKLRNGRRCCEKSKPDFNENILGFSRQNVSIKYCDVTNCMVKSKKIYRLLRRRSNYGIEF